MDSQLYSSEDCFEIVNPLYYVAYFRQQYTVNLTRKNVESLMSACRFAQDMEANLPHMEYEDKISKPVVWIGIYIIVASLFCILAMVADLLYGFRNRKFWFPCKYFSLNAASITVITVAMKLPVDMSNPMSSYVDQTAKLGSLAFMCTMMANLMPSLACMDNKALLANVVGLAILVITIIVNVYIEITTGAITNYDFPHKYLMNYNFTMVAYFYMVMMLFLLILLTSSAITIPTTKQILEFKYQAKNKTTLYDQHPQYTEMSTIEKLRQHVKRYWVMAETGSPQFVMVSNPLSSASGIICAIVLVRYIPILLEIWNQYHQGVYPAYKSVYKKSTPFILITQSFGVVLGTIAPIIRCFVVLSFKLSTKWNSNHLKVFEVEKHWNQKLFEWKESHIAFLSSGRRSRTLVHNLKNLILSLCIGFQKVIVVSCKTIGFIPIVVVIVVMCCLYCWKSLKAMFFATPIASSSDDINNDLNNYVLQLQDEMKLAQGTLKGISNSMNRLIQRAEKEQHSNLLKLLEKSTGFEGVENFDSNQIQPLLSVELPNSWSLPVVTLTCIAIALPNIPKDIVDSLFRSVGEGLLYTHLVEESLNSASEFLNIQRAAMTLWHEVEDNCKWLGNTLKRNAYKGKTSTEILKWFADKAKEIAIDINKSTNTELVENYPSKLIAANSMYRITQTIMLNFQGNIEQISEEQLFEVLSGMILDIVAACLTNIPRVIAMKCHESAIEKREASVEAAAKLLGRTKEIIQKLQMYELPSMDCNQMAFIDEWRVLLKQSIP